MMKRPVCLIAATAVVAAALAGCGSSSSTGDASKSTPLVVLTYAQGDQVAMYNTFFDSCTKSSGYKFNQLQVPANDLLNKAVQLTASGGGPAMIISDNQMVAGLANAKALTPIDLGSLKPADFVQGPFKSGQFQGKQYGVPIGNNGEVIVYNKKLLADANLQPPKSWADLTSAAKKLTSGNRYGFGQTFQAGETLSWNYWAQLWSAGGSIANLDSPAAIESATFWAAFIKDGTAPKASLQWQSDNLVSEVAASRLAMAQVGTWTLSDLLAKAKTSNVDIGITTQVSKSGSAPIVPFGGEVMTAGVSAKGAALKAVNDCILSWTTDTAGLENVMSSWGTYRPTFPPRRPCSRLPPTLPYWPSS